LREAGCLEEEEEALPRPLSRPKAPPRSLEKTPPLTAAAGSEGAISTAVTVPLLVGVDGPQLVRLHGHSPNVFVVVFTKHEAQEAGEKL